MLEDTFLDDLDLDRKFHNLSATLSQCYSSTYGLLAGRLVAPIDPKKFDNASTKTKEIGIRILIVLGAIASFCFAGIYIFAIGAILGGLAKISKSLAVHFQKNGRVDIRRSGPERRITDGKVKIMEWNIRGHRQKDHFPEGGVSHWKSRIDRITRDILTEDPDIIVLNEVYDTSLIENLVSRLGARYAHFYTHLGADHWKEENGCVVITKCAVHRFTHKDFLVTDKKVKRGFETLEIKTGPEATSPCLRIIATQLSPGKGATEMRMEQLAQIIDTLARATLPLPTLFVGSLNVNRESKEEEAFLSNYLYNSYLDEEETHSTLLASQWAPVFDGPEELSDDFISLFKRNPDDDCRTFPVREKGIRLVDCHLVESYEKDNLKNARSDHKAPVLEVDGIH